LLCFGVVTTDEGEVHMKSTFGMKSRRYFLFNDLLLWTDKNYKYKDNLKVVGITIVNERPSDRHGDKDDLAFEIKHPKEDLILYCDNDAEKQVWLKGLQEAIRESKEIEADLNARAGGAAPTGTDQVALKQRRGSHSVHDSGDNHGYAPPPGAHGARGRGDSASQSTNSNGGNASGTTNSTGSGPRVAVPASPASSQTGFTPLTPLGDNATSPTSVPSPSPTNSSTSDTPLHTSGQLNGSPRDVDTPKPIAFHLPENFATTGTVASPDPSQSAAVSGTSSSAAVSPPAATTTITSASTGALVSFHMTPTSSSTPTMLSPASGNTSPQSVFSFAVNASGSSSPAHGSGTVTPRGVPGASPSGKVHEAYEMIASCRFYILLSKRTSKLILFGCQNRTSYATNHDGTGGTQDIGLL
jgi:hypothetical protein